MAVKDEANLSLALTSRWTASARAKESAREDCLFNDPWAAALAGPEGAKWLEQRGGNVSPMVVRTRYFDDYLQDAARQRDILQIVILAAGLDTRAFRLPWPDGTHLYELDQPAVLEYKAQVLDAADARPACKRTAIGSDLTGNWQAALLENGFERFRPSTWLLEGLLFYLPNDAILRVLETVSSLAAPGSRLGFDIVNSITLTSPITKAWIDMQAQAGAPWIGALDDPETLLTELGWQVAMTQPGSPDAHFNRWTLPVMPVKMPNMPHNWYVTADK